MIDILQQYSQGASGSSATQTNVEDHLDQVAPYVPRQDLGSAIGADFRSDSTPSIGQMVGGLFGQSNPHQRAGVLNELVQSLAPGALKSVAGGILGRALGGQAGGTITPQQASQISPSDVGDIAEQAQQQDPSPTAWARFTPSTRPLLKH